MRGLIGLFSVWLLSGCSWLAAPEAYAPPDEVERKRLLAMPSWRMEGRIGVHTREDNWSANLEWRHADGEEQLTLSGPFAQRAATIRYKPGFIVFDTADGGHVESDDPDRLLSERLGFSIPLHALRYWLLALPVPEQNFTAHPQTQAVSAFEQAGWSLRYDSFMQEGVRVLPRKMLVQGQGAVLKLFVDRWRFDE